MNESFTVFAIKYATVDRLRKDNFLHPTDGDPEAPMALDFFVWLVVGQGTALLVDTGFSPASAQARKRKYLVTPVESLRRLGYARDDIKDLVITHLHYDHAGNIDEFPAAEIWVQEREVRYATGSCMCDPKQSHFFSSDDLGSLIKQLYRGNVRFVNGFHQLRDGVELHRVGGHTDGLQVVRVRTEKGWVVLASDAAHYYENLIKENPFPAIYSLDDMRKGYARIRELADGEDNIVPGHDPEVCARYPSAGVPDIHAYRIA
ncbi:N-acyl homoserine lactonase family protein [Noviherbaspirillum sp. Root189]|uniref:N-acyl homoserine lactonase family protein n=1 Tax=Noviherbaspirillum sp. Root189 TaxID=1736487 RepID=UPI00070B2B95|nr:N-acyl homoserine lactonase family protein [Noviherbaspirillum sp. Root189]KRB93522.1 MBL fold metallo-hydrolase [Noviherbaspirillum sp. Root189]